MSKLQDFFKPSSRGGNYGGAVRLAGTLTIPGTIGVLGRLVQAISGLNFSTALTTIFNLQITDGKPRILTFANITNISADGSSSYAREYEIWIDGEMKIRYNSTGLGVTSEHLIGVAPGNSFTGQDIPPLIAYERIEVKARNPEATSAAFWYTIFPVEP